MGNKTAIVAAKPKIATKSSSDSSSSDSSSDSGSSDSEDEEPSKKGNKTSIVAAKPKATTKSSSDSSSSDSSTSDSDDGSTSKILKSETAEKEVVKSNKGSKKRSHSDGESTPENSKKVPESDSSEDSDDILVSDVEVSDVSSSESDDSSSSDSSEEEEDEEVMLKIVEGKKNELKRKAQEATEAALNWVPTPKKVKGPEIITQEGTDGAQTHLTGRPFQRVDDQYWGKEALVIGGAVADNSYEGTFGENGFGAKASAKLPEVRGKKFQHEKTKRKRSFNGLSKQAGGAITMNSFSTKFYHSD